MNLFDVTPEIVNRLDSKPRQANAEEIEAYLRWLAACRGILLPGDATFSPAGIFSRSADGYVLDMPGYDERHTVTLETLDDAGEVIASQTLPVEPKKGGVIWSREDVRRAYGPVEKPAKVKRGKAAPAPIVEKAPTICSGPMFKGEPWPEVLAEIERGFDAVRLECRDDVISLVNTLGVRRNGLQRTRIPARYQEEARRLFDLQHSREMSEWGCAPAPTCADPVPAPADPDPIEDLSARLAALEARIAALPVETVQPPTAVADRPRRSPAHERAIRRAWAERRAFRMQRDLAGQVKAELKAAWAVQEKIAADLEAERAEHEKTRARWRSRMDEFGGEVSRTIAGIRAKRQRAVILARERGKRLEAEHRLVDKANERRRGAEQRTAVLEVEMAKLRADLADPSQPERASDIARLVRERDEARVALAAVSARNAALQGSVNDLAERFEAMVSRVTRAEAALRNMGAGTPLPLPAPRSAPVAVPVPLSA